MSDSPREGTADIGRKGKTSPMKKGSRGKKRESLSHPAQLNPAYHKHDFKEKLAAAVKDKQPLEHDNKATLNVEPFSCCLLPNFIKDELFLDGLKDELLDQIFYERNNDLYKFHQSGDLRKVSTPHVRALRKLLYEDFLDWLKDVTGFPLTDKVDMTCSRYDYTDTLLCHDDELDDRRIAFILYLVPHWKASDGGTLDMFNMDEHGQPKDIARSLVPQWNSFAWFEVSPASHHQVSEVLTEDKTRLSVNGWFHGPPIPRPARYIEPRRTLVGYTHIEEETMYSWINPIYLDAEVQAQIQEKFENDSEIELLGFLKEDKYQAVVKALKGDDIKWCRRGPPNKRNYIEGCEDSLPTIVKDCITFLKSEAMFLTLSNLTGLSLHALADQNDSHGDSETASDAGSYKCSNPGSSTKEELSGSESEGASEKAKPKKKRRKLCKERGSAQEGEDDESQSEDEEDTGNETMKDVKNSRCRCDVRKWSPGCYTLVHDTDVEGSEFALDAMLFCSCKGWQQEYGGYTSYIAKGEDDELLTVSPAENSLALVYRDKDTLRFVKHINARVKEMQNGTEFYDFFLVYLE